jgi:hypothetical protein
MPNYRLEKNSGSDRPNQRKPEPKKAEDDEPVQRPVIKPTHKRRKVVPNPAANPIRRRVIKNNKNEGEMIQHFANIGARVKMNRAQMRRLRSRNIGASETLEPQKDHEIGKLKDAHKNQMAIIGGNGPCLDMYDMESLNPYVNIAVNRNIFVRDPDYWVWVDPLYYKRRAEGIIGSKAKKFKCTWHRNTIPKGVTPFGDGRSIGTVRPDFYGTLYCVSGTIQPAIHLAYIMGCNPIVVIAAPQACVGDKRHFYDDDKFDKSRELTRRDRYKLISHKGYFTTGYFLRQCKAMARLTKRIRSTSDTRIINATGCGIWQDGPEIMNLEQVMDQYGDRVKKDIIKEDLDGDL